MTTAIPVNMTAVMINAVCTRLSWGQVRLANFQPKKMIRQNTRNSNIKDNRNNRATISTPPPPC